MKIEKKKFNFKINILTSVILCTSDANRVNFNYLSFKLLNLILQIV